MRNIHRPRFAMLIAVTLLPLPALAAESYDNCTGFIDSVPATISTQGTWCLRKDIATSMSSGSASRSPPTTSPSTATISKSADSVPDLRR